MGEYKIPKSYVFPNLDLDNETLVSLCFAGVKVGVLTEFRLVRVHVPGSWVWRTLIGAEISNMVAGMS